MMTNSTKQKEALDYIKEVKVVLHDQHNRIKYDVFLQMFEDYKIGKIDIGGMKVRVKGLFKEHTNLISRFNTFMPKEHRITPKLECEDGSAFLKEVKDAFQDETENFNEFLNIIKDWKCKGVDIRIIVARMKELLKEHIDLIFGFDAFLPTDGPLTTCYQFEGDAFHVRCSNNQENYASHVRCSNDEENYAVVLEWNDGFKKKRSKQSKRRDFSSILESGILQSKNRQDVVVCGYNEGYEKLISKKRRSSTSHRVSFEILDMVNTDDDDDDDYDTSSSNEGSKKKIRKREVNNERSNKQLKKRKYNSDNNDDVNNQLQEERPELPLAFKEKIDQMVGSEVTLVMQKELTKSDVTENNGRLSIPENECITEDFLKPEEKLALDYVPRKRQKCNNLSVSVLDPSLTLYGDMFFKKWKMVKSEPYNITGKWNKLVAKNQLKEGQKVQLWSFRSHQQLCFALVML